ncbi:MAG: hypothetical protein HDR23_04950 [Lachnospiraceae bacterium]|nr:hypothetical protein [Lachnospiraceae bacterium]
MNICVDKNKKTVEWNVEGKKFIIHNEHVLYAFQHGENMLMIKEDCGVYEKYGFIVYDIEGNKVYSYKTGENSIVFREEVIRIDGTVQQVDYEEEKRKLVVLKEKDKKTSLLLYDDNGELLAEIGFPRDYTFFALSNGGLSFGILAKARGTSDAIRDDWNFKINFENYYVERKSITR